MDQPLLLAGVVGSPYSRKMRSLLRYRRVPFLFIGWSSPEQQKLPPPPLPVIPALYFPRGDEYEAASDSTFLIRRLEAESSERSVIPPDPVVAFLDFLVEDYADEWTTKMMFHYRWAVDESNASRILPRWNLAVPEELARAFRKGFGQRQVDRLAIVGSNEATGPLIEASYRRLLDLLEQHFRTHRFLMGERPGTSDFALFGQLTQLVQVEPSSQALARAIAPRVVTWCDVVEDLSGISVGEADWPTREALAADLSPLLHEIGRTYAPFLVANAAALAEGRSSVECMVDGEPWTQQPFRYQGKCLAWLREAHAALDPGDRAQVDAALAGTGCEVLFAGDA
jgi:glutathione S-transferase